MPKFTVTDRTSSRFPGDFQIDSVPGAPPSDDEAAAQSRIAATIDGFAKQATAEADDQLRATLRAARQAWRSSASAALRAVANDLAAGADAKAILQRLAALEADRAKTWPDIAIESAKDDSARFKGDFAVSPLNYPVDAGEQTYLNRLKIVTDYLAEEEAYDKAAQLPDSLRSARLDQRTIAATELRKDAGEWKAGMDSVNAAYNTSVIRGTYKGLCERLGHSLFSVSVVPEPSGTEGLAADLKILVESGLPAPNDVASPEKQDLFVELNNAAAVIRTVCNQQGGDKYKDAGRTRHLLDEYINKLAGIGRLGLEGPHTTLAKLALTSLKSEFTAREAGRIKNRYARRLGMWSAGFAWVLMIAYLIVRTRVCIGGHPLAACPEVWWLEHKSFLLAAAGASIGTWVSFSIRRLDLPFEDLTLLDEESLEPPFRLLFVIALTLSVCLLFWTNAINVKIGDLNTSPDSFKLMGSIAILVGLFCGLSERALATAISGRAAAFVRGVAGGG